MSGESRSDDSVEWRWAHILWQRRGLRIEEFADMPRNVQLAYIASEQLAIETPVNSMDRLAKVYIKTN
nr:MAG TPA: hypothetical protein [Caudoviricetes sp.]